MSLSLEQAISLLQVSDFHKVLTCARSRGGPSVKENSYTADDVAVVALAKSLHERGLSPYNAAQAAGSFAATGLTPQSWVASLACNGELILPLDGQDVIPIGAIYHDAKSAARSA